MDSNNQNSKPSYERTNFFLGGSERREELAMPEQMCSCTAACTAACLIGCMLIFDNGWSGTSANNLFDVGRDLG